MKRAALATLTATTVLAGCGGTSTKPREPRDAAGVRARQYAFYKAERAGSAATACALDTPSAQQVLVREQHVSSCPAAFFKLWNTGPGVYSPSREAAIDKHALSVDEQEVPDAKILVVGDRATVIDPGRQETEEYVYRDGAWLFVKQEHNTEQEAAGLRHQAEETESKDEAATRAGEAQEASTELSEGG